MGQHTTEHIVLNIGFYTSHAKIGLPLENGLNIWVYVLPAYALIATMEHDFVDHNFTTCSAFREI